MIADSFRLEMQLIDRMSRIDLIEAVRRHRYCLAPEFLDRLNEKSTEYLQFLLLTGRLIDVLRRQHELN